MHTPTTDPTARTTDPTTGPSAARRATRFAAAALGMASLAAATGCSALGQTPSGQTAAAQPTVTVTAAPAVAPSSPAPSSSAPAADAATSAPSAPAAPAGPPPCPTKYLQASLGLSQGTAGSVYTVLVFKNTSNTTCTLYGYPGVSLAGGTPVTQIGLAAAENPATPRELVTLAPGKKANALLRIVDAGVYPPAKCHPVTSQYLQIYPPNQTTPIYLGYSTQTCAKPVQTLTVNVVQPGSGG